VRTRKQALVKKRKSKTDKVLLFQARPRPPEKEKATVSTSYFQIGSDRFAIHMWHESLPPAPRRPILEPRIKKKTGAVLLLRGPASAEPGSNCSQSYELMGPGLVKRS
jgi:hypothetical protein